MKAQSKSKKPGKSRKASDVKKAANKKAVKKSGAGSASRKASPGVPRKVAGKTRAKSPIGRVDEILAGLAIESGSEPAGAPLAAPSDSKMPSNPGSLAKSSVRIFQIFYDDWHQKLLDPDFEPYDNRGVKSELHEFAVFEKLAETGALSDEKLWGALSWRFSEKTGLTGKDWRAAIEANPGFDIYYCNPFPDNEAVYHNIWVQGEPSHPSFLLVVRAFFEAADLPLDLLTSIWPSNDFCAANYFVASPAVWSAYIPFMRKVLGNAERGMSREMRALLHSRTADQQGFHFGANYVAFIQERLFSVFRRLDGAAFKAFKVPLPQKQASLNVHQRLLRDMRDLAHRSKSKWLAACWINYRNLYLTQTYGAEWSKKYLRGITPTEVKFA